MINHITLKVSDLKKSRKFYTEALSPIGYKLLSESEGIIGLGSQDVEGKRDLWIHAADTVWLSENSDSKATAFSCLAFTADSEKMVNDFYQAALAAGGVDNGAPGYRSNYHPGYYAAFVRDPDGYNIEAVYDNLEKS